MECEVTRYPTLSMNLTALPSQHHVKRALIPVGGRGTRMYPATAAVPKELLAIGNRPLLEFALARAEGAWGVPLSQRRIDCGSPDGYLEAQLCHARVPDSKWPVAVPRVASARRAAAPAAVALSPTGDCA